MKNLFAALLLGGVIGAGAEVVGKGTQSWSETVGGGRTDVYKIGFVGGEDAGVAVSSDGNSDIDLYVYDENDNLVCKSESYGDKESCTWNPRWTGMFKIKIKNTESYDVDYNGFVW